MVIKTKGNFTGNFFEQTSERDKLIQNIQSSDLDIIERLFVINDINKFKMVIENELFFQKVRDKLVKKLYDAIHNNKLTSNEFAKEYINSATDGFTGFCTMLGI